MTYGEKIGYVPQKANLFSGTIASNIAYSGDMDEETIVNAAAIAQATDFIEEKEEGFQSEVAGGEPMFPEVSASVFPLPGPLQKIRKSTFLMTAFPL